MRQGYWGWPELSDPVHIPAWQRLSDEITTSGMPAERNLRDLMRAGVKHVLDLTPADHPEALASEEHELRLLGLGYTRIPVPFEAPTEARYLAFVRGVECLPRPLHVHCVANYRVSAFFYRYHLECGRNESEARALMSVNWEPETSSHPSAQPWAQFVSEARLTCERRRKIVPTGSAETAAEITERTEETDAI